MEPVRKNGSPDDQAGADGNHTVSDFYFIQKDFPPGPFIAVFPDEPAAERGGPHGSHSRQQADIGGPFVAFRPGNQVQHHKPERDGKERYGKMGQDHMPVDLVL